MEGMVRLGNGLVNVFVNFVVPIHTAAQRLTNREENFPEP